MNRNSMTGEPNQQNQTSVFGYDLYPPPYTVNWNQPKPFSSPATQLNSGILSQQPQICIDHPVATQILPGQQIPIQTVSSQFSLSQLPDMSMNFSFGTPRPAQDIVQFPFQITSHGFGQRTFQPTRCKRKTDSPLLHAVKQHITEEKMAEHMAKLHINSETVPTSKESDSDRTQRLYMCEEMRKLQTESILPQSLMARMQSPCTALVLWKPPTRLIPLHIANNEDIDENENNNAEGLPDNNIMDNESEMENINEVIANNMEMDNS